MGERGQEHLHYLQSRNVLLNKTDADGRDYVEIAILPSKNRSCNPVNSRSDTKQARIYDLEFLKAYESCLPSSTKDNSYFPKPLKGKLEFSSLINRGKNYLINIMKHISKVANLSRVYTNHCIR